MKTISLFSNITFFLISLNCFSQSDSLNYQNPLDFLVNRNLDSLHEVDYKKNYIKYYNENEFITINKQTNSFRNISKLELSTNTFKLPFIMTFGIQNNTFFEPKLLINYNIKLDFDALKRQKIERLDAINNIESFSIDKNPESIKKALWEELKKDKSLTLEDSLIPDVYFNKIEKLDSFEKILNNKVEIDKIQSSETLLTEYYQGNKIPNVNYDSLQTEYQKFSALKSQYNELIKDKKILKFRSKINELFQEKEKLSKINDISDFDAKKQLNHKSIFGSFNFKRLDFRKFNIGQSSLDLSDIAIKNHIINGLNIELKHPFIFHFAYSIPFQNNRILNAFVNSMQSTSVSTLGGAIGNEENKKNHYKVGFFNFNETVVSNENNSKNELANQVLFIHFKSIISKEISFQTELSKSSSTYTVEGRNSPTLFDFNNFMPFIGFRNKIQGTFFDSYTKINAEFNHIGNKFYSAGNPFLVRGTEYRFDITQKINSKWSFRSKNVYRTKDRDTFKIDFLSTSNELKFKWTKNTSFTLRNIYYENQIHFAIAPQHSFSNQTSLIVNHRMKINKYYHLFSLTSQYIFGKNTVSDSVEISNGNLVTFLATHNASLKKFNISNAIEYQQKLDSSTSYFNLNSNVDFNVSKFRMGIGGNLRFSNDLLLSYGNSLFFESQARYLNIHFNLGYNTFVQDKFTALNSQLRFSYLFH